MVIRYILFFFILNCIQLNAQNKIKKITQLKYEISKIDNTSIKKDTICQGFGFGCFSVSNYGPNGKQKDLISYDKNRKIVLKSVMTYHENGNLNEIITYNSKNKITFKDKFIYADNKLTRLENYREIDLLNSYEIYVYKKNILIRIEKYQPDNKIFSSEYIKNDKTIKIIEYGYNDHTVIFNFEYNKHGLMEKKIKVGINKDKTEELLETEYYVYDNNKRLTESYIISDFYPSSSSRYEYDANGNWIRRIDKYKDYETIVEKKIEYY